MTRFLFVCFLLAVVLEGAARKWLFPEYASEIFVVKDVLLGLAFLPLLRSRRSSFLHAKDLVPWVILVALVIGHAAVAGWSFETAVGLRYYLAPLPLLFVVPALLRDADDLDHLCRWVVWVAILEGIIGVVQYLSPYDSPINSYVWGPDVAVFGGEQGAYVSDVRARVTGTFSFISTYAAFLFVAWVLTWLLLLNGRRRFDRWLAGIGLVVIAFNMGMNGSRGLALLAGVSGLPLAVIALQRAGLFRAWIVVAALAIAFSIAGLELFEPFLITFERGDFQEATERTVALFLAPFTTLVQIDALGTGVGTTFLGFEQLGRGPGIEFDEVAVDRVGVELGVIAYAYLIGLKIYVMGGTFNIFLRLRDDPVLGNWALISLLVQLSSIWTIPFYNATSAIAYFGAVGLAYWLRGIGIPEAIRRQSPGRHGLTSEFAVRKWR